MIYCNGLGRNGPTNFVKNYNFEAFGNITAESGTVANTRQFQTKETNSKSKLVYFGQRWYNPVVGRWITPDPLGMVDGPNLYAYLNNNPLNSIDPWGLCEGTGFGGDLAQQLNMTEEELRNLMYLVVGSTGGVGSGGKVVIGETMSRVESFAEKIGAKFYKARKLPSQIGIKQAIRNNYQWLRTQYKQGREIIDIGIDKAREVRSIFYEYEQKWLNKWRGSK